MRAVDQSRSTRMPRARWAMITMPISAMAKPATNSLPTTPPVNASGADAPGAFGRVNDSPRTVAPDVVVVAQLSPVHGATVVVVGQPSPVHGAAVVVVVLGTVVVVVQSLPLPLPLPVSHGSVVVVVCGMVVDEQPLWAGFVLAMPLLPSHS